MRREERVTVQGPVKEQQPDGMSHRGAHSTNEGNGCYPAESPWHMYDTVLQVSYSMVCCVVLCGVVWCCYTYTLSPFSSVPGLQEPLGLICTHY